MNVDDYEVSYLIDGLISSAGHLNAVLLAGFFVTLVVVVIRAFRKNEFEWNGIKLHTRYFFLIAILFTFAHHYTAYLVGLRLAEIGSLDSENIKRARLAFFSQDYIVFDGFLPRFPEDGSTPLMSGADPTSWASHLFYILAMISIVPAIGAIRRTYWSMRLANQFIWIARFSLAAIIPYWNWMIGAGWAIGISDLWVEPYKSNYSAIASSGGSFIRNQSDMAVTTYMFVLGHFMLTMLVALGITVITLARRVFRFIKAG